jgi:hypothetical protein
MNLSDFAAPPKDGGQLAGELDPSRNPLRNRMARLLHLFEGIFFVTLACCSKDESIAPVPIDTSRPATPPNASPVSANRDDASTTDCPSACTEKFKACVISQAGTDTPNPTGIDPRACQNVFNECRSTCR